MSECIVRGCAGQAPNLQGVCFRCHTMLRTGKVMPSQAWFAAELQFLMEQNEAAMEHVRQLHNKIDQMEGKETW